jgi:hypothetical protein
MVGFAAGRAQNGLPLSDAWPPYFPPPPPPLPSISLLGICLWLEVLGVWGDKPLACLYQHEPQQGPTSNNLTRISLIVGANLLLPLNVC